MLGFGLGIGIGPFGFAVGSSVDPAALEGLVGHYSSAQAFQDVGGLTPASAGDPVARVDDLSGAGAHLLQSDNAKRASMTSFPSQAVDPQAGEWLLSTWGAVVSSACTVAFQTPSGDVYFKLGEAAGGAYLCRQNFTEMYVYDRTLTVGEMDGVASHLSKNYIDPAFDFYIDSEDGDSGNDGLTSATAFKKLTDLTLSGGESIGIKRGSYLEDVLTLPAGAKVAPYGPITTLVRQALAEPVIRYAQNKPVINGAVNESGPWELVTGTEYRTPSAASAPSNATSWHTASGGQVAALSQGTAGALAVGQFNASGAYLSVNVGELPGAAHVPTLAYGVEINADDCEVHGLSLEFGNEGIGGDTVARPVVDSLDIHWHANDGINWSTTATDARIRNTSISGSGRVTSQLGDSVSFHDGSGLFQNLLLGWAAKDNISNASSGSYEIHDIRTSNGGNHIFLYANGTGGTTTISRWVAYGGNGFSGGLYKLQAAGPCTVNLYNSTLSKGDDANANARGIATFSGSTVNAKNVSVTGGFQFDIYENVGTWVGDYNNADNYITATKGPNSIDVDAPDFVDDSGGDFRIVASGGLYGAGVLVPGINDGQASPSIGGYEERIDAPNVYNFTGSTETLAVPAGIESMTVTAWAGGGGSGDYGNRVAGASGYIQATVPAADLGPSLTLLVGGGGGGVTGAAGDGGLGGFGGGGYGTKGDASGGGGGGYSGVFLGALSHASALVVAGAGGSGTGYRFAGSGGGVSGQPGELSVSGQGGTQLAGGAHGVGSGVDNNSAGGPLTGGNGTGDRVVSSAGDGGGGGAGYYGGGGGAGDGGAGGGGSSYSHPNATDVTNTAGPIPSLIGTTDPAGTSDPNWSAGIGTGGAQSEDGGNGRIVIEWNYPEGWVDGEGWDDGAPWED